MRRPGPRSTRPRQGQEARNRLPSRAPAATSACTARSEARSTATPCGSSPSTARPSATPAPTGSVLLSQGHPVTCSSIEATGTACANAVDGNTATRWSSAFSDPQWIYVDLGATHSINKVVLNWEAAYGRSFQIQTSTDAVNWTSIYSTTTGTGGVQTLSVSGSGRYVRMYGTTRATVYGYSLWEFQVSGN